MTLHYCRPTGRLRCLSIPTSAYPAWPAGAVFRRALRDGRGILAHASASAGSCRRASDCRSRAASYQHSDQLEQRWDGPHSALWALSDSGHLRRRCDRAARHSPSAREDRHAGRIHDPAGGFRAELELAHAHRPTRSERLPTPLAEWLYSSIRTGTTRSRRCSPNAAFTWNWPCQPASAPNVWAIGNEPCTKLSWFVLRPQIAVPDNPPGCRLPNDSIKCSAHSRRARFNRRHVATSTGRMRSLLRHRGEVPHADVAFAFHPPRHTILTWLDCLIAATA